MTGSTRLEDWQKGEPLSARKLQAPVTAIRELRRDVDGIRGKATEPAREAQTSDDDEAIAGVTAERWTFVTSKTETERIEDADDSETYIDVTRTLSITVQRPDGKQITIEFE